jgi:hypothetical protein
MLTAQEYYVIWIVIIRCAVNVMLFEMSRLRTSPYGTLMASFDLDVP